MYELGTLAFSKAGHDKGELFLVTSQEGNYVFLADGRTRTVEHPKKKNVKHIQPVFNIGEKIVPPVTNVKVKKIIQSYKQECIL